MNQLQKTQLQDGAIVLTPKNHKYSIIWMHGLGDTSEGFLDCFYTPHSIANLDTKVILMQAPKRKVTINMGMESTSWFDIKSFQFTQNKFEEQISIDEVNDSSKRILHYLNQEVAAVGSKRVFLGGFSQGCFMSLEVGLSYPQPIGGIIALSGMLFPTTVINPIQNETPLFIVNGTDDMLINCNMAQFSYQRLDNSKRKLYQNNVMKIGHTVTVEICEKLKQFLVDAIKQ